MHKASKANRMLAGHSCRAPRQHWRMLERVGREESATEDEAEGGREGVEQGRQVLPFPQNELRRADHLCCSTEGTPGCGREKAPG